MTIQTTASDPLVLKQTEASSSFRYGYLVKRFFPFVKPYLGRTILNFGVSFPLGLLDSLTALALQPYIDKVINAAPSPQRDLYALLIPFAIITFALLQGSIKYLNVYLTNWTMKKITNKVQKDIYAHLLTLNTRFYDVNSSGTIIARCYSDPSTASSVIIDQLKIILTTSVSSLGLICVLLYNSWQLAFVGVIVMCAAVIPAGMLRKKILSTSNENIRVSGDLSTNYFETCGGNRTITSYNLKDRLYKSFAEKTDDLFDIHMSLTKRVAIASPLMFFIASIGFAIVLWFGNHLILTGQLTTGKFVSFVAALILLYKPMKNLGDTLTSIQTVFVSMSRVFEIFDIKSEIKEKSDAKSIENITSGISFENVTFSYIPGTKVLKNITLNIPKGQTLAVVGNSGGGKTTMVNLLPRFYDIDSGSIKIDGIDIRDYNLTDLRNIMSVVFQDNFLFAGTIRENIMMGNPSATAEELRFVVESAHLTDFINTLPDGLDTVVGERGTSLSGGQRQRVAIARAMIKDAPIVILDEATSALDNESEAVVQKALDNLMQNKTVIVIAHRLSTIQNADRIIVVNEGEIVEKGSHEELMQIDRGEYKHLYEIQFKKAEENKEYSEKQLTK
ncbi:MAG: ABC transporter ATP-binding protein [Candidatus Gastranaerophilaceae bacterium]